MDEVERFLDGLQTLLASSFTRDEVKAAAQRNLATFIGRSAVRGDQFAPPGEISALLNEARARLHSMTFEGEGRFVRVELLTELDRVIRTIAPGEAFFRQPA